MILSIILFYFIQIKANELIAPAVQDHDSVWRKHVNDVVIQQQLLGLFSRSTGILSELPDPAITATFWHNSNHLPKYVRIKKDNVVSSPYYAGKKGQVNTITVDLTSSYIVTGVVTQAGSSTQWVTKFSVETSENGYFWRSLGNFVGNFDGITVCYSRFDKPVVARFLKLTVLEYRWHPSIGLDVLVYKTDEY